MSFASSAVGSGNGKRMPATTVSVETLHSKSGGGGGGGGRREGDGGSVLLPRIARSGGVELPDIRSPPRTSKSGGGVSSNDGKTAGGGGGGGDGPTGLTRKNLTVSAATHSALMQEKRDLEARERELQLVRKNRGEADHLLMEAWLNDALTGKKADGAGGAAFDEPPLELLQQGAAGLHGLQTFGLARDDLKQRGLSSKAIERVYRSMYVYTVGFHDILKEIFSHCEDKAELIATVWAGYVSVSENILKMTFKSEFLEMLGEQRETDVYLVGTRDELAAKTRQLAETAAALRVATEANAAAFEERDQLRVKHRQLSSVVEQERASRHHAQQKYFAEVEHRTAMAEEVAESRELAETMRVQHEACTKAAKRASDQAVRSDTARRQAQENTRKYLEELKIVRERDVRLAKEAASLEARLADVTAELERTATRFQEEARGKILLQADVANKREEAAALVRRVRELEDEAADMRENSADAASREGSLTTERDLLQARLASAERELETTRSTLLRERAGYSKMTAEWGQMTDKVEDLAARESAAVKRALALSAGLEAARSALRVTREANASSTASLARSDAAATALGVGLASVTKALSDERLARRSLRGRLRAAAALEASAAAMREDEARLRADADAARVALAAARGELAAAAAAAAALAARLDDVEARGLAARAELEETREQLARRAEDLRGSEQELRRARAEADRLALDLRRAGEDQAEAAADLREARRLHHEAAVRVSTLQNDLNEARTRGDQASGGLEEAVKKLNAAMERARVLETENRDVARRAGDVGDEIAALRLDRDLERARRERADEQRDEAAEKAARLAESLSDAEQRADALQYELESAAAQLDAVKLQTRDAEQRRAADARSLETQLRDETDAREATSKLLETCQNELAAAHADISALTAAREQLAEDSQQMERMLREAQTVRAFLQGEIGSYKTRCEQYKSAKAEAEVKLDLLREQGERAAAAAEAKFNSAHASLTAKVKDLEEDLDAERAARRADVDVVRQEGAEQVKSWRESLTAEIGTLKIESERAESQLAARELELEKARGDAAMSARVAAVKITDLETRLMESEAMFAASAMTGDEEKQHKHALGVAVGKLKEEAGEARAKIATLEGLKATLERQLAALKMALVSKEVRMGKQSEAATDAGAAGRAAAESEKKKHAVALMWTRGSARAPGDLVVIRRKELFNTSEPLAPPMEFTPRALRTLVMQIFCEKIAADAEEASSSSSSAAAAAAAAHTLEEFTYDFFLSRFGLREVAEHHLHCLVEAVERDYSKDSRVQVFGRMIGVAQPLPAEACRTLLGFLSQLFRLTGGLTAREYGGGTTEVPVAFVEEAADATSPEMAYTLAAEVRATAAEAGKSEGGAAVDLDLAVSLVVRHWEKASEALTRDLERTFTKADVNGDGVMTYDEFRDLVRTTAAAQQQQQPTTRKLKEMFREALRNSSESGSGVTPQAFAATARQHGLCSQAFTGGAETALVPFSVPLAFDEWSVLDGSWAKMKEVMGRVLEMLGELPTMQGELDNLRDMMADFESTLKDRSAPPAAGWALYRRILMIHATHKQRMEVRKVELGNRQKT